MRKTIEIVKVLLQGLSVFWVMLMIGLGVSSVDEEYFLMILSVTFLAWMIFLSIHDEKCECKTNKNLKRRITDIK
jgi:hypothetical protein